MMGAKPGRDARLARLLPRVTLPIVQEVLQQPDISNIPLTEP